MISAGLKDISTKLEQGQRLTKQDGLRLLDSVDILAMGKLALAEKKKRTRDQVFFNVNCHINLTNICVSGCAFCAFSRGRDDPDAYTMTAGDAVERVQAALPAGITEIHMVSGLHPDKTFDYYVNIVKTLKQKFPAVHLKAFTPIELKYFSDISGLTVAEVLGQMQAAGLDSLPGGGAEVLSNRIRQKLCPRKASAREWLEIMQTAHRFALKSNATLLFGHIETAEEIIEHMLLIRQLQDETGGFQAFIPLPFHPAHTMMTSCTKPTAYETLKIFCIARLMLDNIDHIKAYWVMTGMKTAQLALLFGADDIDGTVTEEKITHAAGAETALGVTQDELLSLIKQAGMIPVQRDTLYNIVKRY